MAGERTEVEESGREEASGQLHRPEAGRVAQGEERPQRPLQRESRLQIAVTWVSGMLLLTIVGYLVWEGTRPYTPASFRASVEQVRQLEGHYYVRLRVINEGGQSVQGLGVVLELRSGEEVVERVSAVLDWLPERSSRELVLIVENDPGRYRTVVGFQGYLVP